LETDNLLNERQAAQRLNVAAKTLQKWREVGDGPKFVKLGRCVRYAEHALEAFIAAHTVPHTSALNGDMHDDFSVINPTEAKPGCIQAMQR
jgi:predicted DNA-binding transcriptional regulator AlpA